MDWIENMAWVLFIVLIWEAAWKSVALWKAARAGQKGWYIALLILNTVGILPIVYLVFFQKKLRLQTQGT